MGARKLLQIPAMPRMPPRPEGISDPATREFCEQTRRWMDEWQTLLDNLFAQAAGAGGAQVSAPIPLVAGQPTYAIGFTPLAGARFAVRGDLAMTEAVHYTIAADQITLLADRAPRADELADGPVYLWVFGFIA